MLEYFDSLTPRERAAVKFWPQENVGPQEADMLRSLQAKWERLLAGYRAPAASLADPAVGEKLKHFFGDDLT
jgi:hypothetical protein